MMSLVRAIYADILEIASEKGLNETDVIRFNSPVIEIDNKMGQDVRIKVSSDPSKVYVCNRVLVAIPIAVADQIKFSKISKAKQLIFDNQELGNVTRVYLVFPTAFWRVKYSGYASFSSKFFFN